MKTLTSIVLLALSTTAFAAAPAACPAGSQTIAACASTPAAGDEQAVGDMFDSVAVCAQNQEFQMVYEKSGLSQAAPVEREVRAGGVSYTMSDDDMDLQFSMATGTNPMASKKKKKKATLTLVLKAAGEESSTTYTCK